MAGPTPRKEYYVQTGSMFENPHGVPHDEIVRMILENSAEVVAQTVFGKYVEMSGLVFTGEMIAEMIDTKLPIVRSSTFLDKVVAAQAQADLMQKDGWWGNRYFTGIDFGRKTDYTVITTIDTQVLPARVVYYRRLNRVPWDAIYAEVGRARHLFGPNILCDSTGMGGDVVMDALESRGYCPKHHLAIQSGSVCMRDGKPIGGCSIEDYLPLSCCDGYGFTGTSKTQLVEHLRNVLSIGYDAGSPDEPFGLIRTPPIPQLQEELTFYAWDDAKLETDCLFSLALSAWAGLEEIISDPLIGSVYGS